MCGRTNAEWPSDFLLDMQRIWKSSFPSSQGGGRRGGGTRRRKKKGKNKKSYEKVPAFFPWRTEVIRETEEWKIERTPDY